MNFQIPFPVFPEFITWILVFISVLVRKRKSGDAELVLLDHGLYEKLPDRVRNNLCNLWKAIILHDHAQMRFFTKRLGVDGVHINLQQSWGN